MEAFIRICKETIVDLLEDLELFCDRFDIKVIYSCETDNDKIAAMVSPFETDKVIYVCKYNGKKNQITIKLLSCIETVEL